MQPRNYLPPAACRRADWKSACLGAWGAGRRPAPTRNQRSAQADRRPAAPSGRLQPQR